MKANIYYFSGTKNTKFIADMMGGALEELGYDVVAQSIENNDAATSSDLIVIGGPIYAGNMPEKLIRWVLRNVPKSSGTKAIVFSSSASMNNAYGVISIGKKLIDKGYDVIGQLTYVMPRNYYFGSYQETEKEVAHRQLTKIDSDMVGDLTACLVNSPINVEEKVFKYDMLAETMSLMSRFMGKNFEATDKCIKCGLCVKSCPTGNIELKERPIYRFKCMMCTRCIHNCPVNAITYKKQSFNQYKIPTSK